MFRFQRTLPPCLPLKCTPSRDARPVNRLFYSADMLSVKHSIHCAGRMPVFFAGALRASFLAILLFVIAPEIASAQDVFFRQAVHGGATGGGYSPPATSAGSGLFTIAIPTDCTIRQAYLLAGRHGPVKPLTITFDGTSLLLDASNQVSDNFDSEFGDNSGVNAVDVTDLVRADRNVYPIVIPTQNQSSNRYADFYLWVCFERADLKLTHVEILLNDHHFSFDPLKYEFDLTPPNCFDLGLGLMCGYICNADNDAAEIFVNNNSLGKIGGNDPQSGACGGPAANFSYFDGILRGQLEDTADPLMSGNDVLAKLNSYVQAGATSFEVSIASKPDNAIWAFFLNHGIPELNIVVTEGSLPLCVGETVTLTAVGDFDTYLWSTESQSRSIVVDKSDIYSVIGFGANGCSKTASIEVPQRSPGRLVLVDGPSNVVIGACEEEKVVWLTIQNDGPETIEWTSAESRNPAVLQILSQPAAGSEIAARGTVQLQIRVTKDSPGRVTAVLELKARPCVRDLTLNLQVEKDAEALLAQPDKFDFGNVPLCVTPQARTLRITNRSDESIEIGAMRISPAFSVMPAVISEPIPAGESIELTVRPLSGVDLVVGQLGIDYALSTSDCSGTLEVALSARFIDDALPLDATPINFPPLLSCERVSSSEVIFSNRGAQPISIVRIVKPVTIEPLDPLPLQVPPNGVAALRLRYSPPQPTQEIAAVQFEVDFCEESLFVPYNGRSEKPHLGLPDSIDFGDPLACGRRDSTISLSLLPAPDRAGDFVIERVEIDGPFSTTLQAGSTLRAGQLQDVDIRFEPPGIGDYSGALSISFQPCDVTQIVYLKGSLLGNGLAAEPAALDFGILKPGQSEARSFELKNQSTALLRVSKVSGITAPFSIDPDFSLPFDIEPGASRILTLRLQSTMEGEYSDELEIFAHGGVCGPALRIPLSGAVTTREVMLVAYPELRFAPDNSIVTLPLLLRELSLPRLKPGSFDITVRIDRRVFLPEGFRFSGATTHGRDGEDHLLTTSFAMPASAVEGDTLLYLDGRVMYDEDFTVTPIIIEDFTWTGSEDISVDTENGQLAVDAFCINFGLDFGFAFGIQGVTPNPADGHVAIGATISRSEETVLTLYNNAGVAVLERRWPAAGHGADSYRVIELSEEFARGVYHVQLRAGELRDHRLLMLR